MNFAAPISVLPGDTRLDTPTAPGHVGTSVSTRDGRRFRLVKAFTALAPGQLVLSPYPLRNEILTMVCAPTPIGARSISVTANVGTTSFPANTFAGGVVVISKGTGRGSTYAVRGHGPIALAGVTFTVQLEPEDPITVALDGTSRVDLVANSYLNVIVSPGGTVQGENNAAAGIAAASIAAGNYGFVQVGGVCGCLIEGPVGLGQALYPNDGAVAPAGSIRIAGAAAGEVPRQVVGYAYGELAGITDVRPVLLTLP
jgi:hypothetical protein